MTAAEIHDRALRQGLRLERRGDMLAIMPADRVSREFVEVLRQHKTELMEWLSQPTCPGWQVVPPTDLPLNPLVPKPSLQDRERVIAYLLRQGCNRSGPLTAWLVRRESAYYEGPGRHWDCALHAYGAARDAACWQLRREEAAVWDLLQTFEDVANHQP